MTRSDSGHWNQRYQQDQNGAAPQAARVLLDNRHLLPATGRAVDIACGRGGNALLLADHGLETLAWDYAEAALTQLTNFAREKQLSISCECRDVVQMPPPADRFDVITLSNFLDRELFPYLIKALRPGGLIFYQTFILERVTDIGPDNPSYRLAANELLHLFRELRLVYYREEGCLGDPERGFRDQAQYIGRKTQAGGIGGCKTS